MRYSRQDPYETFQRFLEFTERSPLDCILTANDLQAIKIPKVLDMHHHIEERFTI